MPLSWAALVAALMFIAYEVGAHFSRRAMFIWYIVTVLALFISQAARLRLRQEPPK